MKKYWYYQEGKKKKVIIKAIQLFTPQVDKDWKSNLANVSKWKFGDVFWNFIYSLTQYSLFPEIDLI